MWRTCWAVSARKTNATSVNRSLRFSPWSMTWNEMRCGHGTVCREISRRDVLVCNAVVPWSGGSSENPKGLCEILRFGWNANWVRVAFSVGCLHSLSS